MNRKHHSGVFLMEMTAVIFFFILCAAVCLQTFVKADSISRKASDLNQSVLIAQSVAEVWKAKGAAGLQEQFQAEVPEDPSEGYVMGFDRTGDPCEIQYAVFHVRTKLPGEGQAEVAVSRNGEEVYTLRVYRHETKD
ncbi:hypothetical protein [Clostridium sp. Marseille-P2415]|uniref:hypothetical protein n=1 Tax=Clostridium sp. Marseille-P2415 TaxID=1805471 RepID=UPI000988337F|nr:hypothetical protein [Clostridium sp. Marseille-P2415]